MLWLSRGLAVRLGAAPGLPIAVTQMIFKECSLGCTF